ncbi:hypothetical protein BF95_09070 [Sphingobium sp. Ant17]|nr:hypothetical protein BF95_09070 [Sphingobium sp. Ant17]
MRDVAMATDEGSSISLKSEQGDSFVISDYANQQNRRPLVGIARSAREHESIASGQGFSAHEQLAESRMPSGILGWGEHHLDVARQFDCPGTILLIDERDASDFEIVAMGNVD